MLRKSVIAVYLILAVLLVSAANEVNSQVDDLSTSGNDLCGTIITPEQVAAELARDAQGWPTFRAPQDELYYVPIAIHIIRRSDGTGGMSLDQLFISLRDLNDHYLSVGMQFFSLRTSTGAYRIDYIDNDTYYEGISSTQQDAIRNENPVEDAMNVWFLPNFYACGTATYTSFSLQGIVMNNACTGIESNKSTFAHEVGHYFDLYHTHETSFGVECPDGGSCNTTGDKICDTPADPNLSGLVSYYCDYYGGIPTPAGCNGTYDPQVENLMSYSRKHCRDLFTPYQMQKMVVVLTYLRDNLFNYDTTDTDSDGIPDVADNCPEFANAEQFDSDMDFFGDECDNCPGLTNTEQLDDDLDSFGALCDNCPDHNNPGQEDTNSDGVGDVCTNTETGTNISYGPDNGLTVTFDNVSVGGWTIVEQVTSGPAPPYGYGIIPTDPDIYYEIKTNVTYFGMIEVCIEYDDSFFIVPENELSMWQYDGDNWVNITQSIDESSNVICGETSTLSPIIVAWVEHCCGQFTGAVTGNTNCDTDGLIDLADITRLIDYVYITKEELCCLENGNINGDETGLINLADITKLIDHVYITKAPTAGCE